MAIKTYNVNLNESINPIQVSPVNGAEGVDDDSKLSFTITVSDPAYRANGLTAVIDANSGNVDIPTLTAIASLKDGTPTGALTGTAGGTAISVAGGALLSEAAVGDFIHFVDQNEWGRIASIGGNEDLDLEDNLSQNVSGDWDIYDSKFAVTGGQVGAYSYTISKIEASNDDQQTPENWTEVGHSTNALQVEKLDLSIPKHIRFQLDISLVDNTVPTLDELGNYNWYLLGSMESSEYIFVDELTV